MPTVEKQYPGETAMSRTERVAFFQKAYERLAFEARRKGCMIGLQHSASWTIESRNLRGEKGISKWEVQRGEGHFGLFMEIGQAINAIWEFDPWFLDDRLSEVKLFLKEAH